MSREEISQLLYKWNDIEDNFDKLNEVLEDENLKKILFDLIKEKLMNNELTKLDKEIIKLIDEDDELFQIYLEKIKELGYFDDSIVTSRFNKEYFFSSDFLPMTIDYFKKEAIEQDDYASYLELLYGNLSEVFGSSDININMNEVNEYLKKRAHEELSETIDYLTNEYDDEYIVITNEELINEIVKRKLYKLATSIRISNPSSEVENFILERLEQNDKFRSIETVTPKIKEYCINHDKVSAIAKRLDVNDENDLKLLKQGLEDGVIGYYFIPNEYKRTNRLDPYVIRAHFNYDTYLPDDEIEVIKSNPLLIKYCIDCLLNSNYLTISDEILKIPEIALAMIENSKIDFTVFANYKRDAVMEALYPNYKDELINALKIYVDNNITERLYIVEKLVNNYPDMKKELIGLLAPEEMFEFIKNNDYEKEDIGIVNDIFKEKNIEHTFIPTDFQVSRIQYEDAKELFIAMLNSCSEKQLYNMNIALKDNPELTDIVLRKIVELHIPFQEILSTYSTEITPYFEQLINDPENPLQLDLGFYTKRFNQITEENKHLFINYIEKTDKIASTEMDQLLNWYLDVCLDESQANLVLEVLIKALESNKFDKEYVYERIGQKLIFSLDEEQNNKLLSNIESYIKKQSDVPIDLSSLYGVECVKENTLKNASDEDFLSDDTLFCSSYDGDYEECLEAVYEAIVNRLNNNQKVSFELLCRISNTIDVDYNLFNNPNLVCKSISRSINMLRNINNPVLLAALINRTDNSTQLSFTEFEKVLKAYVNINDNSLSPYMLRFLLNVAPNNGSYSSLFTFYTRENNDNLKRVIKSYLDTRDDVPVYFSEIFGIEFVKEHTIKNLDNSKFMYFDTYIKSLKTDNKEILQLIYNKYIETINNGQRVSIQYLIYFSDMGIDVDFNYIDRANVDIHNAELKDFISNNADNDELMEKIGKKFLTLITIDTKMLYCIQYSDILKKYMIECILADKISFYDYNRYCFDPDVLEAILQKRDIGEVVNWLIHYGSENVINEEVFKIIEKGVFKRYKINQENFKKLASVYGYGIVLLCENEIFLHLVNQEPEIVNKFIRLFKKSKLDRTMIEGINDSLRQNIFAKKNPDVMMIFVNIMTAIEMGITDEDKEKFIEMLMNGIPVDFDFENTLINYYKNKNNSQELINGIDQGLVNLFKIDRRQFFEQLFYKITVNQNVYSEYLHILTDQYIHLKRNEFAAQNDIFEDTNIRYIYDQKKVDDYLFDYMIRNELELLIKWLVPISEEDKLSLTFIVDPDNEQFKNMDNDELIKLKKNISNLRRRFYEVAKNKRELSINSLPYKFSFLEETEDFKKKIKKIPIIPDSKRDLADDLSQVNLKVLFDKVFADDEKYQMLLRIVDKYKIMDWGEIFEPAVAELAIGTDNGLGTFINAFSDIYDAEIKAMESKIKEMQEQGKSEEQIIKFMEQQKKNMFGFNAYKILKYCSIYGGFAGCYKVILGIEDFEHVKANKPRNEARGCTAEQRLEKCCKMQIETIQNHDITIPSFIEDEPVGEDKKMRVIVGNRAAPFNLTHGERTGACMRAYGYADNTKYNPESMFEKMNSDPRCFHITFVDPKTGEYVSRVSGFRNGNTIFLNQLRFSVSKNYTTEEVIEACKQMARQLIEKTKDSEMPIENVVVSPSYAMQGYETQYLSESDIGKGVYRGHSDVNRVAVVLATIGENGKAVKVKLNSEQPMYKCVRMPVVEYNGDMIDANIHIDIQRIRVLKACVEHSDDKEYYQLCGIDPVELETEYVHVILGQDFVVTMDKNYEIRYDIVPGDERAKKELEEALNKMENMKQQFTNGLGGKVND